MNKNFFLSGIIKILLLCALLSTPLSAQFVEPKFDEIKPLLVPKCLFQDSYGFIWIGDEGGLVKYDGYNLKRYDHIPFDSTSMSNRFVNAISEDKKGNLLIGTMGGLNYFDLKTETFTHYKHDKDNPNTIMSNLIEKIIVNDDGSLWIGTQDKGLIYMNMDRNGIATFKNYDLNVMPDPPVLSGDNYILDLFKDSKGILWIGTIEGGLKSLDPLTDEITHYRHEPDNPNSISSNIVSSICEDDSGNLWIGTGTWVITEGNGLNKFDPDRKQFTHYYHDPDDPSSLCSNNIMSLIIDKEGVLWLGTVTNKLSSIPISELLSDKKPHFTHYTNFDRYSVWQIYEDRTGNIWAAFVGRSVFRYNKQQNSVNWYRYIENSPYSLSGGGAMVQEDKSGNLWFGGYGLKRYDPIKGKITRYEYDPNNQQGLSSPYVMSICEDKYGYFWIGTEKGINRLNPETGLVTHIFENPKDTFGLRSNHIREVLLSQSGDLWVASDKSGLQLYSIEKDQFYYYDLDPDIEWEILKGMHLDQSGILWIYTFDAGCFALRLKDYKVESIKHYFHDPKNPNSLRGNLVGDLIRPRIIDTNAVWIAGDGLNRLDLNTETFTHFTMEDGLPSNMVLKILEDDNGNIWCSCESDIAMYDIRTGEIKVYSDGDGLPFSGFGSRPQNACKTSDGQLIFGGGGGALGFYPEQMKENLVVPPIYLTDFKIFHESVKLDTTIQFIKRIELTYDQNVFSFDFTALNFTNAEKNQYAYKLEGLFDDWIHIGNERVAGFTDIEPGKYIFRVKGSNNHGVWNETGASVILIITPPWWATTWAYIIYALITLSIIYYTWRLQLRRIRIKHDYEMSRFETEKMHEVDEMKNRFFANISHEFRTPLTLILGISKKILHKAKDQVFKDDIGIIKRNANRLHGLVNQLLDLSKLESGNMTLQTSLISIIPLLKGLVLSFASFAERKRITLKFNSVEEDIIVYIDKDKIEKIVTNLLSNAFKFTPQGGKIEFHVIKLDENIEITVSDTGIGITPERIDKIFDRFYQVDSSHTREHEGTGLGLALTKELVELHKGKIRVESSEGKGSTFTITLPLGKDHLKPEEIVEGIIVTEEVISDEVELNPEYEEKKVRSGIETITDENKLLILLVEDNADVRNYIKENLEEEYRILEAVDGEDGLIQSIKYIPDLVISDVMMPKMDGFEMCDKMKNDERTSHIPIIMLTAKATNKDKIDGYKTGADEYIMKPFDTIVLKVRINNLIQQRKRLREHFKKEGIFQINDADVTSTDKIFLKKALKVINNHISDETFSVDVFAEEIAMSKSQLRRKLVVLVGESTGDLIRSIRLRKAAKLIEEDFGNISEIAAEVGYNNPANFARSFKTQFGVSPTEYLNSKKA
jgi:signal transduction histidine kinase/ligand-binding sensor domain-containing protein/DNA-binding response OmpR family regulator